jgi:hypothetical protein
LTSILDRNGDLDRFANHESSHPTLNDKNVRAQLALGGIFRASYEFDGSQPKHPRYDSEKPFTRFDPEDRSLGSVLAAMLALLSATWIYLRGWTVSGGILAAYGIFGLMLRIDLWSLAIRIM